MIKILKLFLFTILAYVIFTLGKNVSAYTINNISMNVYVNSTGNANVTEIWNCTSEKRHYSSDERHTEQTEFTHDFYNLNNSAITNLSVSMDSIPFTITSSWDEFASFEEKAYMANITSDRDSERISFGVSEYGTHTYTIKYTITNFVNNIQDGQMINFTLLPDFYSDVLNNATINIISDFSLPDTTEAYNFGNSNGTVSVSDEFITFNSNGSLSNNEQVKILVKFPADTFNVRRTLDNNFEYYYNESIEKVENRSSVVLIACVCLAVGFVICSIFMTIFIVKSSKEKTEKRLNFKKKSNILPKQDDIPYFRDFPCNNDLLMIYFIGFEFFIVDKKTDILGAILLKWIKDKKIIYQRTEDSKIKLIFSKEKLQTIDVYLEKELYNMFLLGSVDGILEQNEFNKWCAYNEFKILDWFNRLLNSQREKLIRAGLLIEKHNFFFGKKYIATPQLRNLALNIAGLKKYLIDYTAVGQRDVSQVLLLEDYLVIAELFKITSTIEKEFKDMYPTLLDVYYNDLASSIESYTYYGVNEIIAKNKKK